MRSVYAAALDYPFHSNPDADAAGGLREWRDRQRDQPDSHRVARRSHRHRDSKPLRCDSDARAFRLRQSRGIERAVRLLAADHQLTLVQGCSPQEIPARPNRMLTPWAFSPSGQWLLAGESSTLNPDSGNKESLCETVINSDGSGATQFFSGIPLGNGFNAAIFSSDGRYVETSFYLQATRTTTPIIERLGDVSLLHTQGISFFSGWTSQPGVAVAEQSRAFNNYLQHPALYNVETQALTPLQAGSDHYIWAPVV